MHETYSAPDTKGILDMGNSVETVGFEALSGTLIIEEQPEILLREPSGEMPIIPVDALTVSTNLPVHDTTPGKTRRLLNGILALKEVSSVTAETVELLLSEVVTNAVTAMNRAKQQDGLIGFQASLLSDGGGGVESVLFAVVDRIKPSEWPIPRAGVSDEGGRGLFLVRSLCRRWGICPHPDGKVVWVEV